MFTIELKEKFINEIETTMFAIEMKEKFINEIET
jgi:hypothetical protein